jgi:hypothetical protein
MGFMRRGALVVLAITTAALSIDAVLLAPGSAVASTGVASLEALGMKPIEPTANKEAVLPYSTAKERLDPNAVQYYVNTFHVSEEVASERLTLQTMVPNLKTQLAEALGTDFGSLWFDNTNGQWVIDARSAGASSAEHLMSNVGLIGHYRIVTVAWNAYELQGLRSDLELKLSPAIVGIAGDHISVKTPQAVTSAETQTVTQARQAFAAAEGVAEAPTVETGLQSSGNIQPEHGSIACGKYGINDETGGYCNTLVAGDRWYMSAGDCTLAWWVSIKNREPKEFPSILTAGHCIADVGDVEPASTCEPEATSCRQIGLTLAFYQGGGLGDAGLIDYYSGLYGSPTFPLASVYWNWWDSEPSLLEYYQTGPASKGEIVCENGYRSGSSCGEVLQNEVSVDGDGHMIEIELTSGTSCKGDSGAPYDLASKDTAVAMNDLGDDNEHNNECGKRHWATSISEPVKYWGLSVWGGNSWHEPW